MQQQEQILCAILDAGELLLTAGAEVARVEDTSRRMAAAYGFGRADVLTITASMIVTAQSNDGAVLTQTRRILRRETNMQRIEAVNALDYIIIGNIMLLIPGIAFVTSLRDMIVGDTISGLLGAFEALLRALAIAAGCALVLMQLGGTV